jgi:hypothetical protein
MNRPDIDQALGGLLDPAEAEVGCDGCFEQLDRHDSLLALVVGDDQSALGN